VDVLLGDPAEAKRALGWEPKAGYKELAHMMIEEYLKKLGKTLP
jgi:GDPmannose 4,6-dehydratase